MAGADGRSAQGLRLIWALVFALLLAPALGQMHRAVHGHGTAVPGVRLATAQTVQALAAPRLVKETGAQDAKQGAAQDWVHALFAGHHPAECQLLDQLHHSLGAPPPALSLAQALPPAGLALPALQAPRGTTSAAHFDARAPPRLLSQG